MAERFDFATASPADVLAEVARRKRNVAEGRRPTEDGHTRKITELKAIDVAQLEDTQVLLAEQPRALVLRLPWSLLIADNRKYAPALRKVNGTQSRAVLILTEEYRVAKNEGIRVLKRQLQERPADGFLVPLTCPVVFVARLFEPGATRGRDLTNYAKLVQDVVAAAGAIVNDKQIDRAMWIRMPCDIDAPRLEITITPLNTRGAP